MERLISPALQQRTPSPALQTSSPVKHTHNSSAGSSGGGAAASGGNASAIGEDIPDRAPFELGICKIECESAPVELFSISTLRFSFFSHYYSSSTASPPLPPPPLCPSHRAANVILFITRHCYFQYIHTAGH